MTESPFLIGVDFSDHFHHGNGQAPSVNIVGLSEDADIVFSKKVEAKNLGELYKIVLQMAKDFKCQVVVENNKVGFIHYAIEHDIAGILYNHIGSKNPGFYVNSSFGGDMTMPALLAFMALSKKLSEKIQNDRITTATKRTARQDNRQVGH